MHADVTGRSPQEWLASTSPLEPGLTFERRLTIKDYHPAPYVSAELFYESQYSKISSTNLYAGCLLPVGKTCSSTPIMSTRQHGQAPKSASECHGPDPGPFLLGFARGHRGRIVTPLDISWIRLGNDRAFSNRPNRGATPWRIEDGCLTDFSAGPVNLDNTRVSAQIVF